MAFLLRVRIFDNGFFFSTLSITFKQLPSFYFMLLFLTLKCLRLLRAFSQRRVQWTLTADKISQVFQLPRERINFISNGQIESLLNFWFEFIHLLFAVVFGAALQLGRLVISSQPAVQERYLLRWVGIQRICGLAFLWGLHITK